MRRHFRGKELLLLGVLDALENGLTPEVVGLVVGFLVEEHVFIGVKPEAEAALLHH